MVPLFCNSFWKIKWSSTSLMKSSFINRKINFFLDFCFKDQTKNIKKLYSDHFEFQSFPIDHIRVSFKFYEKNNKTIFSQDI